MTGSHLTRPPALLDHVREFVGQQTSAVCAAGSILAFGENDIAAHRIRERPERARRSGRRIVKMNPDVREVVAEPRLEKVARVVVKQLAWRS